MIQPLRTWHHRIALMGAVLLPAVLALGVLTRKPWPDASVASSDRSFLNRPGRGLNVWDEPGSSATLIALDRSVRTFALGNAEALLANIPDPLLYWSPVAVAPGNRLPDQTTFVSALRSPFVWKLPDALAEKDTAGYLFIYSLAFQEIRAVSRSFSWSTIDPTLP